MTGSDKAAAGTAQQSLADKLHDAAGKPPAVESADTGVAVVTETDDASQGVLPRLFLVLHAAETASYTPRASEPGDASITDTVACAVATPG